jgi:hypothetical protein
LIEEEGFFNKTGDQRSVERVVEEKMHYNRLTEFVNRFASREEFNEVSNKAKE